MKTFLISVILMVTPATGFGIECQHVLKDMRLVQLDPLPVVSGKRSIASLDTQMVAAKKKRIALMKNFLDNAPLDSQKSFATLMINYFLDESIGKTGNLLDGMDLLANFADKKAKPFMIKPNDPTNQILSYLSRAMAEDLNDVKGLTTYLLRAKNLKATPKKVLDFLNAQVSQGNFHFAVLQKDCVVGDPTLDLVVTQ